MAGGERDGDGDAGDGDHLHRSVDSDPQQDIVTLEEEKPVGYWGLPIKPSK